MSATFQVLNYSWPYNNRAYFGNMSSDTMSFGGVLSLPQTEFGVFPDPVNATAASEHFLSRLYATNQLLNPVIGMRFDPLSPKITIGALDENDYQGHLNWVPIITPNASWSFRNMFTLDGLKGYNGSVLPNSSATYATLDSGVSVGLRSAILIINTLSVYPNSLHTLLMRGTLVRLIIPSSDGIVAYVCNSSEPYVALTATINGVDYPIDSTGNLLRSISSCWTVGLGFVTTSYQLGIVISEECLLLPITLWNRAYRFPTDSCPGFYGFAFPSGNVNRTSSQIAQTPASTPTQSSQCLVFSSPTATPSPSFETVQQIQTLTQKYRVWGEQIMVNLFGEEGLGGRWEWNVTSTWA
ncbi:hypothetical protein JVT61DRAFT_13379 [Boletus reticuloceps]|uniref:Peptidase A1 domain-containing protein n=1 Tax=Boletus reticuloceps TaxID=495285 RepID=A0A8I2YDP0_9AGAM|nr:hypothetical protein JVT61DRAFT_13379 [Boletus reticuloceps]